MLQTRDCLPRKELDGAQAFKSGISSFSPAVQGLSKPTAVGPTLTLPQHAKICSLREGMRASRRWFSHVVGEAVPNFTTNMFTVQNSVQVLLGVLNSGSGTHCGFLWRVSDWEVLFTNSIGSLSEIIV